MKPVGVRSCLPKGRWCVETYPPPPPTVGYPAISDVTAMMLDIMAVVPWFSDFLLEKSGRWL